MELARVYKSLIDVIVAHAGSAALLHVHVGLALYLGTLLLVPRRRGAMLALQVVLVAELANEMLDWLAASPQWTWADTTSDFVLTLVWPVAITAVGAWRRRRWRRMIASAPRPGVVSIPSSGRAPIAFT
jgi:hypothetical protein